MMKKYILNCFLLTLPILFWNLVLTRHLPEEFQAEIFEQDLPSLILYGAGFLRIIVFATTLLMPLGFKTASQRKGWGLYLFGVLIYFSSWLALISFPDSTWSRSVFGFSAPSYTPILWLVGIGLVGDTFFFSLPYSRAYFLVASFLFLLFHNIHVITVYYNTH